VSHADGRGASFAALHVLAATVLILAADPTLKPSEVRRILIDSADPVLGNKPTKTAGKASRKKPKRALAASDASAALTAATADHPIRLNIDAAIQNVRQRTLLAVAAGSSPAQELASLQGLSAATGFTPRDIDRLIENPAASMNAKDLATFATIGKSVGVRTHPMIWQCANGHIWHDPGYGLCKICGAPIINSRP